MLADLRAKGLRSREGLPTPGVRKNVGIRRRRSEVASRLRRSVGGDGLSRLLVRSPTGPGLGERRLQKGGVPGRRVIPGRPRPLAGLEARP